MLNNLKLILPILLLSFTVNKTFSQALPVIENFTFSGNLTANGWLNYPTAGVNTNFPATSTTGIAGLTFTGYSQSGIGNAARILNDGEDVYKPFDIQTSGTVYAGAMIKVNAAPAAGDYFYHFYGKNAGGVNYQYVRFYVKDNAGIGFNVAVNKTTLGPVVNGMNIAPLNYSSTIYPYGSTIFVVIKYTFNPLSNPDDPAEAYVFTSTIPTTEPTTPTLGPVTAGATAAGDAGQLLGLSLRRNDPSMDVIVDGITVANTWAQVLPVTLSRFDVRKNGNNALVSWNATLEKDEPKYTSQQSKDGVHFEDIFTQNSDNKDITFNKKYEYEVKNLTKGTYYFRLKMTDKTAWSEKSAVKSVRIDASNIHVTTKKNILTISYENESDFLEKSDFYIVNYQGRKVQALLHARYRSLAGLRCA